MTRIALSHDEMIAGKLDRPGCQPLRLVPVLGGLGESVLLSAR